MFRSINGDFTNFDLVDLMVDSDWSKIEFMNLDVIAI